MQRATPEIVIVTATPMPADGVSARSDSTQIVAFPDVVPTASSLPTQDNNAANSAPRTGTSPTAAGLSIPTQHIVQSGETLFAIAGQYGLTVDEIVRANRLENPDLLVVGQVLALPEAAVAFGNFQRLIADDRVVRSISGESFDVAGFIASQPGVIRQMTDLVDMRLDDGSIQREQLTASEVIERISREFSVDARLLLALIEYRAGLLSQISVSQEFQRGPFIAADATPNIDRDGLYKQLSWLANQLNEGYYGSKYRGNRFIVLNDNTRVQIDPLLNSGTIAVQQALARTANNVTQWRQDIEPQGFVATYMRYFGNPLEAVLVPFVPPDLSAPTFILPFELGVEWRFTGGPHGGWASGSAWASLDFAPGTEDPLGRFCYVAPDWVVAIADGVIAYSDDGSVVLDLDGDGRVGTGWTIHYLHISSVDRIAVGTRVRAGQRIGRPACSGGVSFATHFHIGRQYNGEWIPADCQACDPSLNVPAFVLSGWRTEGILRAEYQGALVRGSTRIVAEQSREATFNRIRRES